MEYAQRNWLARSTRWPRRLLTWTAARVNKRYQQLKHRYGVRYTKAMLFAVFIAVFVPIPGGTLLAIAAIAGVGEVHRAISKRRRSAPIPKDNGRAFESNRARPGIQLQHDGPL
jgi:hypothetical protein